jgi:hypothetical protein
MKVDDEIIIDIAIQRTNFCVSSSDFIRSCIKKALFLQREEYEKNEDIFCNEIISLKKRIKSLEEENKELRLYLSRIKREKSFNGNKRLKR